MGIRETLLGESKPDYTNPKTIAKKVLNGTQQSFIEIETGNRKRLGELLSSVERDLVKQLKVANKEFNALFDRTASELVSNFDSKDKFSIYHLACECRTEKRLKTVHARDMVDWVMNSDFTVTNKEMAEKVSQLVAAMHLGKVESFKPLVMSDGGIDNALYKLKLISLSASDNSDELDSVCESIITNMTRLCDVRAVIKALEDGNVPCKDIISNLMPIIGKERNLRGSKEHNRTHKELLDHENWVNHAARFDGDFSQSFEADTIEYSIISDVVSEMVESIKPFFKKDLSIHILRRDSRSPHDAMEKALDERNKIAKEYNELLTKAIKAGVTIDEL